MTGLKLKIKEGDTLAPLQEQRKRRLGADNTAMCQHLAKLFSMSYLLTTQCAECRREH